MSYWTLQSYNFDNAFLNRIPREVPDFEQLELRADDVMFKGRFTWNFNNGEYSKSAIFKFKWGYRREEERCVALSKVKETYSERCHINIITDDEAESIRYESMALLKHFFNWPGQAVRKFCRGPVQLQSYVPVLCNVCQGDMMEHQAQCVPSWMDDEVSV